MLFRSPQDPTQMQRFYQGMGCMIFYRVKIMIKTFKILYDTWENIKYSLHSNDPCNKYCVNYMKTKKNNYPLTSTQNGTIALDHSQNTRPPEDKSSRHYTERDFSPAKLKGKCHKQHLIIWLVNLLTA